MQTFYILSEWNEVHALYLSLYLLNEINTTLELHARQGCP